MTWLTWRQSRTQTTIVYGALAVLGVILAITGVSLAHLSRDTGTGFFDAFTLERGATKVYFVGWAAVLALPAIIGVFWGAPLVSRELEAGTHRLAWTQSVTRTRWLATKVGIVGLAGMAATGLLSLGLSWWSKPIDAAINAGHGQDGFYGAARLAPGMFDARGIAPIGYAAFAFALGVAAGLVLRRTVPAMAVTLAVFLAVQIAVPTLVRGHLSPAHLNVTVTEQNFAGIQARMSPDGPVGPLRNLQVSTNLPGAWVLADETVNATGHAVTDLPLWFANCMPGPPRPGVQQSDRRAGLSTCFTRLAREGYRQRITYQPRGRYWAFQAYETAAFIAFALALIGFCFWRIRRLA
jgi:hypothetical protein